MYKLSYTHLQFYNIVIQKNITNFSLLSYITYTNTCYMAFGKEIKRLRLKAGLSAQKMADILGVGSDRLRQWEKRDSDPKDERDVEIIENKLGVSIKDSKALETLPRFDKTQTDSFSHNHAIEILLESNIESIATGRAILAILSEVQAPLMKDKTLPTQLLSIYQKMVKDLAAQVGEEQRAKLRGR